MATIDVRAIIDKYYPEENELKNIYNIHAANVASLALEMARRHPELDIDLQFLHVPPVSVQGGPDHVAFIHFPGEIREYRRVPPQKLEDFRAGLPQQPQPAWVAA